MKTKFLFFLLFSLLSLSSYSDIVLPDDIILPDDINSGFENKFYFHMDGTKNINSVINIDDWEIIEKNNKSFGYFDGHMWVKSRITNKSKNTEEYIFSLNSTTLDYVDFFILKNNKIEKAFFSGDLRSFSEREIQHRYNQIPLDMLPNETVELYIKVETKGSITLPFTINYLINEYEISSTSFMVHGIFAGFIFVLILYNFLLFLAFKEYSYLFYVLFSSSTLIFQIIEYGFALEYIWPENPMINTFILPSIAPWVLIFMSCFFIMILNLHQHKNYSYYLSIFIIGFNFVLFLLSFFIDYNLISQIETYSAILTNFIFLIIVGLEFKRGDFFIKLILVALIVFSIGIIIFVLGKLGLITNYFIAENGLKFGQSLEILLLSFALTLKVNKLVYQVSHDKLTGVLNRLGFDFELKDKFLKCNTNNTPINLLMIDVDKFKNINDRYGHVVGDKVLIHISNIIKSTIKQYNLEVYRYGGEEFSVILPNFVSENAVDIAESIRQTVLSTPYKEKDKKLNISLSISIGCGTYHENSPERHHEDLIKYSDKLLYEAKRTGRNKVVHGNISDDIETINFQI